MKKNDNLIRSFKVLSLMLSYPESFWMAELDDLLACLYEEQAINVIAFEEIKQWAKSFQTKSLLTLQADYVASFDQNQALSLHLFEHIHGESRDRGQAMVDLTEVYHQHGFAIEAKELPDHLPLFLEFLSMVPKQEATNLLRECLHIIERLAQTLADRGSPYTALFNGLLSLANQPLRSWTLKEQPIDDYTAAERLDKAWEEEEVKFLNNTCASDVNASQRPTIHSVPVSNIVKKSQPNPLEI